MTIALDGPLHIAEPDVQPTGELGTLIDALEELDEANEGYDLAHRYYDGTVLEFFASPRLRRAMLRSGIAFRFNFAKIPVNATAERLKLAAVTCATDTAADSTLRDIWLRNKIALQSRQFIRRACEFGDAYVMVWPAPDVEGAVDVFYNSPQCARVFYDEENPLVRSHAVKRWVVDGRTRVDVFYPDRIEKWITRPKAKGDKPQDWEQFTDQLGDSWPYENPFGEIPLFHFRTEQPYGVPRHKGFYGPQDAIHKLVVSHMAGVDYQAYPQRWATTHPDTDTSEAAAEDEDVFAFADSGTGSTVPPAGEARSQFSADPGSVWYMRGVTGVGQFETADHHNFTDPMLVYLRFGAEITNTPLHRIDPTGDHPSGESLRTAEAPFVNLIEDLQLSFGDTCRELFGFALRCAGHSAAEVTVRWTPAQTVNDLEGWQTVQAKINAGVPPAQAFMEAGFSDEQVKNWFGDKGNLPWLGGPPPSAAPPVVPLPPGNPA